VISGTTQGELEHIIAARGWTRYFAGIYGYPAEKAPTLRQLKAAASGPICYLGDALSDAEAAHSAGVDFYAVNMTDAPPHFCTFRNLRELLEQGTTGILSR
jgi:phosphoglycolate phosphatase-like HAD superfamily hydrolase